MDWSFALRVIAPLVTAASLGYIILLLWRRRSGAGGGLNLERAGNSAATRDGLRPKIGFSRLDGMASPTLLLYNKSHAPVWVEEAEILLADLIADEQVAEASCHETLRIRQTVPPRDMLSISLSACIYKAAGEPQRRYSCILSSTIRHRVGEKWIEKKLEIYRIQMIGLLAHKVRRERNFSLPPRNRKESAEVPEIVEAK